MATRHVPTSRSEVERPPVMRQPQGLGAQHRRPSHVAVMDGRVICTLTRRVQPLGRCLGCLHLQGTLEATEAWVLCSAPGRRVPRPPSAWRRVRHLIFDQDWPDEEDES